MLAVVVLREPLQKKKLGPLPNEERDSDWASSEENVVAITGMVVYL